MAILSGDIVALNRMETTVHAVGAAVIVRHQRKTVGFGVVSDNDDFEIEMPDDVRGEVEIVLGMHNAAPSLAMFDGNDLHVTVLYSNVNNFMAG